MKLTLLCFGRSKFPFVSEGVEHYLEQLRHLADEAELLELRDSGSDPGREAALLEETLERRRYLGSGKVQIYLLDERGRQHGSREFAAELRRRAEQGAQRFVFVIGGAYGFPDELRTRFPLLSLSKLTFPHDLARLVLAEQLYRALQILRGGAYHHE